MFLFALGGWGDGGRNGGGTTTREEIAYGFDMNGLENGVRGIQQGLCDGFYAMNTGMMNGFSGIQSSLCQGFAGVNAGMNQNAVDITAGITALGTQLGQCCCDTRAAIGDVKTQSVMNTNALSTQLANCCCDIEKANMQNRYDAQTYNCNTLQAIDKLGDRIIDFMTQDKIATLTAENQSLKFAASQAAQNAFITANQEAQTAELIRRLDTPCPIPAYVVPNPNCCYQYNVQPACGCGAF